MSCNELRFGACSLGWLKRFAHNELILGSNPSRPTWSPAYNLLCGVGSTKVAQQVSEMRQFWTPFGLGGVAQSGRALRLHRSRQKFESSHPHFPSVAQRQMHSVV